jgi:hypothetical protein
MALTESSAPRLAQMPSPGVPRSRSRTQAKIPDMPADSDERFAVARECNAPWSNYMSRRRRTLEQVVCELREADQLLGEGMELPEVFKGA